MSQSPKIGSYDATTTSSKNGRQIIGRNPLKSGPMMLRVMYVLLDMSVQVAIP